MAADAERIHRLLEPTVTALGLELWGIEHVGRGRQSLLRIYIDSDDGVDIDDCERVSRQVSAVLDVEDPIKGEYTLEVSSPGLDRPLFVPAHYRRFIGSEIKLRLRAPHEGRRKFKGLIDRVEEDQLELLVDGERFVLPFSMIEKASLAS